VHYLL